MFAACGDIDIRNNVDQFQKLVNCTVIEGELQILLIDYAKPEDYESLHFPDLVEIKDYLLLYRVQGLRSLRNIFPNLAVIRGEKLFSNYALIAFEMQSLEELGLVSLTSIPKGAVRLEKNPNLCYIETIDWTKIATGIPEKDNFFKGNKDTKECVNMCYKSCDKTMGYDQLEPRCWTLHQNDCQRMLCKYLLLRGKKFLVAIKCGCVTILRNKWDGYLIIINANFLLVSIKMWNCRLAE